MKTFTTLFSQIVILGLLWFHCQNIQAQCTCDFEEVIDLPRSEMTNRYIPDDCTSMKYVKVNFHFMMKSDSTLNFTPYDDGNGNCEFTAYDYSEILMHYANTMLSQNGHMNLPPNNNTPVLNRKYRLKLEGIYFHYDDNAYTYYLEPTNLNPSEIGYYSENIGSEINVFFLYNNKGDNSGGAANTYANNNKVVKFKGAWQTYMNGGGNDGFWGNAWVLVHETCHNMGLLHTMQNGDFCSDINDGCSDTPLYSEIISQGLPDPCPTWNHNNLNMSNNLMDYSGYQVVTPEQLGRIHYTLMHDMFSYLYDDYCTINPSEPECVLETGRDLIWENDRILKNNLVIENGAKLTLKDCILHVPSGANIIVKPGGQLIVDGATITNRCGLMWQGIEVWGNKNVHQYEINGSYGQGYLELKNGAVIENAKCAVELWRPHYWGTTGGIIHATDATFRNNTTAVRALCYTNFTYNTHKETSYNAYFNNCTFVVDENYSGTETFHRHVTLADVNGISFNGCDFSAKRGLQNVHQWCVGINAYDAGVAVNSLCNSTTVLPCPDDYLDKSTFTGFCAAIRASSNGSHPRSFSVRNSVFTNNDRGIHAENTGFPTILMNEFCISDNGYCDYNYGIITKNVTGFCIEENSFHPSSKTDATTIGIAIYNSNGINDIYHNTFSNLARANLAFGQNICSPNGSSVETGLGLTYTCNENNGNQRDFMVLQTDGVGDIQSQQGSLSCPSGNTFRNSVFQFYNDGSNPIEYYYNSNETDETPSASLLHRVNIHGTSNINPCTPHYGNGSVVKSTAEKTLLESDYLSAYTTFTNLKQLYENRIDGGNTEAQISDITNATSADMWQLRAQLLGISPYVSGQVLTTAAERNDIFTDPVLFEILSANPDELKNDSLISYLENKTNPLPNYMIDLLRQIATGITARTAMVAQLGKYGHDYSLAAGDMVRSNLNDSISNPSELRQWLGNMNDIAADRMAVSSYLNEGDSASAFALANMIPQLYGLQGNDLTDHHDYMRLINLYQTLKSTHRTVYEMTETETATVDSIAELGTGISKSMAQSLLEQVLDTIIETCPDHIPDLEEGDRGRGSYDNHSVNKAIGFTTNIGPNPATTLTTVEYTLPSETSTALLTLTNTLGINVLSTELNGKQGSKVLDLRGLATGIYIYTIKYEQHIETGKLVITK